MVDTHDSVTDTFQSLAPILQEDTIWFSDVAVAVGFPDSFDDKILRPESFDRWYAQAVEGDDISPSILRDLSDAHQQMVMEGMAILEGINIGQKPSEQNFKTFVDSFHLYAKRMRSLELDSAIEGSGVDQKTGLRLLKLLDDDMKRELERLERQGTQFCITMFRIDGFDSINDKEKALKLVADHTKATMRPFDDAYYADEGHFVLSMKQTDLIGAEAGIDRLNSNLRADESNIYNITMTFCLVEPSVGEKADDLLRKMRQDLNENHDVKNTVLKFREISDLERYIGSMGT